LVSPKHRRRAIEALEPAVYAALTYYEKWAAAITSILISAGKISRADIEEGIVNAIL
jgi:hypothetical protein